MAATIVGPEGDAVAEHRCAFGFDVRDQPQAGHPSSDLAAASQRLADNDPVDSDIVTVALRVVVVARQRRRRASGPRVCLALFGEGHETVLLELCSSALDPAPQILPAFLRLVLVER